LKKGLKIFFLITLIIVIGSIAIGVWMLTVEIPIVPSGKIALIRIEGSISSSKSQIFGGASSEEIIRLLKQAREDPSIKAVVIRINSPGGSAAASQEIYGEIIRLKKSGKPVVASIGDIATSGGYYVASAANKIVAEPGAITGSIGAIMVVPQLTEFLKKLGIEFTIIKNGEFKDITSPYREITPEEKQLLQKMLTDVHEQFIKDVSEGRGIEISSIREIADGRIFTGKQAKELRLIDEFGNLNDAIDLAAKLAGIEKPKIVEFERKTLIESLLGLIVHEFMNNIVNEFQRPISYA